MYLKRTSIASILFVLAGCSERNVEYYEQNIEAAQAKMQECEASMKAALMSKDQQALEEMVQDKECDAAMSVTKKHKQKIARIKRELKEKELAKRKQQEQAKFDAEYEKQYTALKDASYEQFYKLKETCGSGFGLKVSAECKAYRELKEIKKDHEINSFKEQYANGELEQVRDKLCKGLDASNAYCDIAKVAAAEQQQEKVEYYLSNRKDLKKNFNECHAQFVALNKEQKFNEANKLIKTYQCSMVKQAAAKLKVYSFRKPIGKI